MPDSVCISCYLDWQQFFCSPERMYCQPPKTIKNISKISWNDPSSKWKPIIQKYPDFPVPAHYAHPFVLKRMQDIMKDGRAQTIPEALTVLKDDLKALNSNVTVEKEEYDEIVAIKPMFLVMDYK